MGKLEICFQLLSFMGRNKSVIVKSGNPDPFKSWVTRKNAVDQQKVEEEVKKDGENSSGQFNFSGSNTSVNFGSATMAGGDLNVSKGLFDKLEEENEYEQEVGVSGLVLNNSGHSGNSGFSGSGITDSHEHWLM